MQQLVELIDGSTRSTAVSRSMSRSFTMSTAILTAACAVRLPLRVCSMYSLPLLDGELDVLHVLVVPLELVGDAAQLLVGLRHHLLEGGDGALALVLAHALDRDLARASMVTCGGADAGHHVLALRVRPGTRRRSSFSPVDGSRVNATPVAQSSPRLPNTIACTLTAVPHSAGMPFSLR